MENKRILISRTDRIGDVLLSTPVPSLLRKHFPNAFISFLTSRYASVVLQNNNDINEILYLEDEDLGSKIKNNNFDTAIVLFPNFDICKKIFFAGIPLRIGPANKWFVPLLLNKPVFQHRSRVEKHEADYNIDLLRPLGIEYEKGILNFVISEEAKKFALDWKIKNKITDEDKFIIIHPGMKGSALNWPMKYYAKLADKLIKENNAKVLFSYGTGEEKLIQEFAAMMKEKPIILENTLDLPILAGLISEADLLFCGSTGILHLAVAVKTKTASIFSPILVQSKKRWGPYGDGHIVFEPPVNCGERFTCKKDKCEYSNCMEKITVESVFEKIRQ